MSRERMFYSETNFLFKGCRNIEYNADENVWIKVQILNLKLLSARMRIILQNVQMTKCVIKPHYLL